MKRYLNCFIAVLHFGFYFCWQRLLWIVPAVRDIFESGHPVVFALTGIAVISAVLFPLLAVILFSNYSIAVGIGVGISCYLWIGSILDRSLKDINYNYIYSDASWILRDEDREVLNQIASILL